MENIGYKKFLLDLKKKGCKLYLKANMEGINKLQTYLIPDKYYFNRVEAEFIYSALQISKRRVRLNEVFFIIQIIYPNGKEDIKPIPKTDLLEILRDKNLNIFEYVYSLNENDEPYMKYTLYHGTQKSDITNIKNLKTSKGSLYGDFGRGIYVTPNSNYARSYLEITDFKRRGRLLHGICANKTINQIIYDIYNHKNKLKAVDKTIIEGKNNTRYVLKMYSQDCPEWRESLWNGWVLGEPVTDCDIVIGPISNGKIRRIAERTKTLYRQSVTNEERNKIKENFLQGLSCIYLNENGKTFMALQICIYQNEVLYNIIEGG